MNAYQNQTAEPIITKTLSFEDLQEMPSVMDALSNFNLKKNGVAEKPVYNTTNDFWVDTDRVLYIERGDYNSFTFPISRNQSNGLLENLFLNLYNGKYQAFILRYNFSSDDMAKLNAGIRIDNILTKLTMLPIRLESDLGLGINIDSNYTAYGGWEAGNPVYFNGACYYIDNATPVILDNGKKDYLLTLVLCTDCTGCAGDGSSSGTSGTATVQQYFQFINIMGGGGGSSAPGGGSGQGVGGGTNNLIIGVVSPFLQTIDEKNVAELKKLGTNASIKATFTEMRNRLLSTDPPVQREFGYAYKDNASPESLNLIAENSAQVKIKYGVGYYGDSHLHPDPSTGCIPMFSWSDIFAISMIKARYGNLNADDSKFVFTLTAKFDSGVHTFAIKIRNWAQFSQKATEYDGLTKIQRGEKDKKLAGLYKYQIHKVGIGYTDYITTLMKYLNSEGITGIDIYISHDSSMTEWSKFVYNSATGQVTEIEQP